MEAFGNTLDPFPTEHIAVKGLGHNTPECFSSRYPFFNSCIGVIQSLLPGLAIRGAAGKIGDFYKKSAALFFVQQA